MLFCSGDLLKNKLSGLEREKVKGKGGKGASVGTLFIGNPPGSMLNNHILSSGIGQNLFH